jgi:hypothetical protein
MHRKKHLLVAIVMSFVFSAGCSNKAAYEMIQTNKIQACERMAEGQAREDCLRGYEKTYSDYERDRNRLLRNKKKAAPKLILPTEKATDDTSN